MYEPGLIAKTEALLGRMRARGLTLSTAESCTGGLFAGLVTECAGSSDVFERGFVTYSNDAKTDLLGVDPTILSIHGAVSAEAALAMVAGALANSNADVAVAITGIAGPTGGSTDKPVGLVHIAVGSLGQAGRQREYRFGDIGRKEVRLATLDAALDLLAELCTGTPA